MWGGWGDGEMGRWGDGEMGRWGDGGDFYKAMQRGLGEAARSWGFPP
ncbi:MAG: hypothetical protein F6K56_07900 [Moorea sp. SIO3G5]|nr:hypothetical protein [Moorena sp. SIO3G5]